MKAQDPRPLAFECFGAQIGKSWYAEDFQNDKDVERAFDLAQIQQLFITAEGWQYLFESFGIEKLFEIDRKSGWFETEDGEGEWLESIYSIAVICGYHPSSNSVGTWDESSNTFTPSNGPPFTIDWQKLRSLSIKEVTKRPNT